MVPRDVSITACLLRMSSCDSGVVKGCATGGRLDRTCADAGAIASATRKMTTVRMIHPLPQLTEASTAILYAWWMPAARAAFAGLIDYAGLFPPASLPLDDVVRNYGEY